MRLSPAPRAIQCVLVSRWPRCTWARPAGRRAKDVYISYPQSCGGSEQRTVSGQTIESCTHVGERAVKRVASAGPSRGCCGDTHQEKGVREMTEYAQTTESRLTVMQRVAICFTGGVLGALAVVLFSHVLFGLGISGALGVKGPVSLKSPDIYRPLFWGGLWGIPFGLCIKTVWERLYLFGLLYFLAPVMALCF